MDSVSRPLIAVLAATVLVFALWLVALKPSSSSSHGGGNGGLGQYQSAINQARGAVGVANHASAAAGATIPKTVSNKLGATTAGGTAATKAPARVTRRDAKAAVRPPKTTVGSVKAPAGVMATGEVATVDRALAAHKVVALLFYNPAGADDNAVKSALSSLPTSHGRVVKAAVPVTQVGSYSQITTQVQVTGTPTLVLINRLGQASTIVGYTDEFEIAQRVADALGA